MSLEVSESEALQLWRHVTLAMVHDEEPDLTVRQMAVLFIVYLDPPPHTVRDLARKLGVTKPVITRALNALGKRGLLQRRRSETDRRNVLVQRTVEGVLYLDRLARMIREAARELNGEN